jgi:hypothetical protein
VNRPRLRLPVPHVPRPTWAGTTKALGLRDDDAESGASFSKVVAGYVAALWGMSLVFRLFSTLYVITKSDSPPLTIPGPTWQDVTLVSVIIVASHGRSMVRYALSRSSVGVGAPVTPGSDPAPESAKPHRFAALAAEDERGDHPDRELVE